MSAICFFKVVLCVVLEFMLSAHLLPTRLIVVGEQLSEHGQVLIEQLPSRLENEVDAVARIVDEVTEHNSQASER